VHIFTKGQTFLVKCIWQKVISRPVKWLKKALFVKKKTMKKNFQKLKFNFEKKSKYAFAYASKQNS
jgi:hypothetical protein